MKMICFDPIAEKYPGLKEQFELVRTDSEQMKKDLKEGLISQWYIYIIPH